MMLVQRPSISCVIICRNESETIGRCIEAVKDCVDEIIVVDSGSTDSTIEILKSHGITPHYNNFRGFGAQKRYACALAKYNWILSIDADEIVSDDLKSWLRSFSPSDGVYAYSIARRFCFLNRTFRHGHSAVDHPIRLFRGDMCWFDEAPVHESVIVSQGALGAVTAEIRHESYRTLEQYLEKFNNYTSLGAQILLTKKSNRGPVIAALSIPVYFFKHYILWGNYRNGREGLIWSVLSSLYPFVKVAKAWTARKH